jgi:hypothetical protein
MELWNKKDISPRLICGIPPTGRTGDSCLYNTHGHTPALGISFFYPSNVSRHMSILRVLCWSQSASKIACPLGRCRGRHTTPHPGCRCPGWVLWHPGQLHCTRDDPHRAQRTAYPGHSETNTQRIPSHPASGHSRGCGRGSPVSGFR